VRYVAVAEVARPHGIKGELRLKVYNADSEVLLQRPELRMVFADGSVQPARFRQVRRVPSALLVRFEGVNDRNGAEALRGATIEVARELLGEADDDEYFACDLEGCRVMLDERELGRVRTLASYPTCDVLVIDRPKKKRLEVPLHGDFIASIDTDSALVVLRTIEGLE
jgi:16S rRNA processing protein RimM